jgi:hypothetical protein
MVYFIQVCRQLSVWHIPLLSVQWVTPDDGQRDCPKHVEFRFQYEFEKLVHLVGFIIRKLCNISEVWTKCSEQVALGKVSVRVFPVSSSGIIPPTFYTHLNIILFRRTSGREMQTLKKLCYFWCRGTLDTFVVSIQVSNLIHPFSGSQVIQLKARPSASLVPWTQRFVIISLISILNCFNPFYQKSTPGKGILTTEFHISHFPSLTPSSAETVVKGLERPCNNMW